MFFEKADSIDHGAFIKHCMVLRFISVDCSFRDVSFKL
jgi:hypothetical protein